MRDICDTVGVVIVIAFAMIGMSYVVALIRDYIRNKSKKSEES